MSHHRSPLIVMYTCPDEVSGVMNLMLMGVLTVDSSGNRRGPRFTRQQILSIQDTIRRVSFSRSPIQRRAINTPEESRYCFCALQDHH